MSIILNALRYQSNSDTHKQALFWSNNQKTSRFYSLIKTLVIGLMLLCFIGMAGFSAVWFFSSSKPLVRKVPLPIVSKPVVRNFELEAQQAFERNDFPQSIELFKQALAQAPNNWVLLNNLGLSLEKTGKLEEAESYFFKAIAANVNCASCYNNLGDLEIRRNFLDEAELYYQKATKADPDYADPYFNLGVLYEKTADLDAAVDAYQNFLELLNDPESPLYKKVSKRLKEIQANGE